MLEVSDTESHADLPLSLSLSLPTALSIKCSLSISPFLLIIYLDLSVALYISGYLAIIWSYSLVRSPA